jgi:hypothetical protein
MTDKKQTESAFAGCCPGADLKFPAGDSEKMAEMMQKFWGNKEGFDREAMFQMMQKCCASSEKE